MPFRKEFAQESIYAFVESPLPRGIGICEINLNVVQVSPNLNSWKTFTTIRRYGSKDPLRVLTGHHSKGDLHGMNCVIRLVQRTIKARFTLERGAECKAYDSVMKHWRHLGFWDWKTFKHTRMPRVKCLSCNK